MRYALLLALFMTIVPVKALYAKEMFICPLYHAQKLKTKLPQNSSDKFKHCALSCQLALRCSAMDTMNLGILKEIWDLVSPGNAEWADLEADALGIRYTLTKEATTDKECFNKCDDVYWVKY